LRNNDQVKTGNVIFKFLERGNIESMTAAQTFDRVQTDALTGVNNKGALINHAPGAFKKAEMLGVPLSVLTFDIDHFKKVNDTYGHPAGDYVLREITKVVKSRLIRENDFFARSGGEEFVLILLGSNQTQAAEVASRIRQTIQNHVFQFEGQRIPVTISLGVASKTSADKDWNGIFERADKALYQSKNQGRNRVTVSG
jgi:diguanylate cyclase (GGDEF)-like protein